MHCTFPTLVMRLARGAARALLILGMFFAVAATALADAEPEESRAHYNKAAQYVEAGKLREAVIELKNALQQNPANVEARLLLGNVYLLLGDAASAESALTAAERHGAEHDRVVVQLGRALLLQGRFTEVLDGFGPEGRQPAIAFELRLLRGDAQMGLGRLSEARATYEDLGNQNSEDARIPLSLARIDLVEGKLGTVERQAAAALALKPDLPEASFLRAEARRQKGDPEGAVPLYRDTLDSASMPLAVRIQAHLGLTAALITLGRDAEAEAELSALQSSARDLPLAAYLAAVVKVRANDFVAARNVLQKNARILEEFAPAQFLFGIVHYATGELDTARSWLSRYLNDHPDNLPARKLLAATLLQLNAVPDAVKLLQPAVQKAPNDSQLLFLLGCANLRNGHVVEAAELLQRAAELEPSNPHALGQLAISQIAVGQDEQAMATLSSMLDLGADAGAIGYALAFSHLRQSEFAAALQVAQNLRQRLPDNAIAPNVEGVAYVALGRLDEARDAFETALRTEPGFLAARINLAALKAQAGDLDGAETNYLQVLERNETHTLALMGLAALEHRRGNASASRSWFEKVAGNANAIAPAIALAENVALTDLPEAIRLIELLAASHPNDAKLLVALGRLQERAGRSDDAVGTYKRLVAASGGNVEAQLLLAQGHLAAGATEVARRVLEDSLAAHPQHTLTAAALVRIVETSAGTEASLAYLQQLQRRYPDVRWSDQLLGDLHWRAGRFEAALHAYETSWTKAPSAALAIALSQARMQPNTSQRQEAAAILEPLRQWLASHPTDDGVRLALANTQLTLGELEAAREIFEALTVTQAYNSAVWNNLAWLYQRSGDARAVEYGERALALAPEQPEIMDTLGWILLGGGQVERAASLLRQAHQAVPNDPDIAFHYAAALHRSGDDVVAKKVLQLLLEGGEVFPARSEAETLWSQLAP